MKTTTVRVAEETQEKLRVLAEQGVPAQELEIFAARAVRHEPPEEGDHNSDTPDLLWG